MAIVGGGWLSDAESIELLADQAAERWIPQTFDDNRHDVSALVERWSSKACAARARPPGIGKSARSAHGQQLQRARAAEAFRALAREAQRGLQDPGHGGVDLVKGNLEREGQAGVTQRLRHHLLDQRLDADVELWTSVVGVAHAVPRQSAQCAGRSAPARRDALCDPRQRRPTVN